MPIIRKAYDRERFALTFVNPSLTKQASRDECDINQIMRRYQKTGIVEHVNKYQGRYGDFLQVTDYQTALNQVQAANDAFMSLPSSVRSRFDNDPAKFLEFMENPLNQAEMIKLGLAVDLRAEPAVVVDPPPQEPAPGA